MRPASRIALIALIALFVLCLPRELSAVNDPPRQERPVREFAVTAADCSYTPARLDVSVGDRVRIAFTAQDAPHSFVIAAYRISKRAVPGRLVTIEFLADGAGTFSYFSDLSSDQDCTDLRGELNVIERASGGRR